MRPWLNRGNQDSGAEKGEAMFDELIRELRRLEGTQRLFDFATLLNQCRLLPQVQHISRFQWLWTQVRTHNPGQIRRAPNKK